MTAARLANGQCTVCLSYSQWCGHDGEPVQVGRLVDQLIGRLVDQLFDVPITPTEAIVEVPTPAALVSRLTYCPTCGGSILYFVAGTCKSCGHRVSEPLSTSFPLPL